VDKFTKWIEVKLATSITTAKVVEFVKEIMYQFCSHKNLMAHVEQSEALSRKAKLIAFLFKATKASKTTKSN
jgi:hypothetical protein